MSSQVSDNSSSHTYFTQIPNIIFELGLKSQQLSIYLALKRSAGDHGFCTKSIRTLAKESGVDEKTYVKWRDSLSQVNPILKKPLIIIEKRVDKSGNKTTDSIEIIDIWPENMEYFLNKKVHVGKFPQGVGKFPQGVGKTGYKEEPIKNNQERTSSPTPKKSDEEEEVFSFSELARISVEQKLPFSPGVIINLCKKFSFETVKQVLMKFNNRSAKSKLGLDFPDIWIKKEVADHQTYLVNQLKKRNLCL